MTRLQLRIVWGVVALLVGSVVWRAATLPDAYRPGVAIGPLEDRRDHHFRDLSYAATERLFDRLLATAEHSADASTRAQSLARLSALQRERGLTEAADAAAREALRFAPQDPEVRRLLSTPLDLGSVEHE